MPEKVVSAQCVYDRVCTTAGGMGELQPPNQVLGEKEGKGRKEEEHMYLRKEERGPGPLFSCFKI